jgi:hypothetical protein
MLFILAIAQCQVTRRSCDTINVMEKGRIIEEGTFAKLSLSLPRIQAMARMGLIWCGFFWDGKLKGITKGEIHESGYSCRGIRNPD